MFQRASTRSPGLLMKCKKITNIYLLEGLKKHIFDAGAYLSSLSPIWTCIQYVSIRSTRVVVWANVAGKQFTVVLKWNDINSSLFSARRASQSRSRSGSWREIVQNCTLEIMTLEACRLLSNSIAYKWSNFSTYLCISFSNSLIHYYCSPCR